MEYFPTEASCKEHFRAQREREGIKCKKCGSTHHYWLASKSQLQCTSNENNLVVYPNPSNGDFSVEVNSVEPLQEAAVVVYDISGKQVQRREINHSMVGSNMISFSNTKMEKGAYLIVIESKNKNNFKPEKLVIN